MMRPLCSALALLVALLGTPSTADAQFVAGAHGGYNLDVRPAMGETSTGAALVGGQLQFRIAPLPIIFNPGVDLYLKGGDEFTALQIDTNLLLPFTLENEWVTPYIGGGLAVTRLSTETTLFSPSDAQPQQAVAESTTDYGINAMAGVLLGVGAVRPFVQLRATLGNHAIYADTDGEPGEAFGISAGVLFRLSQ